MTIYPKEPCITFNEWATHIRQQRAMVKSNLAAIELKEAIELEKTIQ